MISIIIPTYRSKKEEVIAQIDNIICQNYECEIIFSDGESDYFLPFLNDVTAILDYTSIQLKVVQNRNNHSVLSRSQSMNLAAKEASGDLLLFLHIDTFLPPDALHNIEQRMKEDQFIAGGFLKRYDQPFAFGLTEKLLNYRTNITKQLVGTNALFIRSEVFKKEPFPEQFMEDILYSDHLIKKFGRKNIVILPDQMTVSSMKYIKHGPFRRILVNALVMLLHRTYQIDLHHLEEIYKSSKEDSLCQIYKKGWHFIKLKKERKKDLEG